jgi:hypothetical protein
VLSWHGSRPDVSGVAYYEFVNSLIYDIVH